MLKKEYNISKSNLLTEMRSNSMTVQELRFLSIYISKINPLDRDSKNVEFKLCEFQKIMSLGRINQKHIEDVFDRLLGKIVKIPVETGKRTGFAKVVLFNKCQCLWDDDREETLIVIDAHDDMLPLLFDLKDNFLKYQLWNCLRLKSVNQVRLYEILKQYETKKNRTISIVDLKDLLGIDEKEYKRYVDFKTKVIEVCKKALKENTDICFEYTPIKKGRKVAAIEFLIFKNKDYKDPLQLNEFIKTNEDVIEVEFDNTTLLEKCNEETSIKKYSEEDFDESTSFLASAVDFEFSQSEMNLIFSVICKYNLCDEIGVDTARFHYLSEKYAYLNVQAKKTNIANRFAYFKATLTDPSSK